MKVLVIGASGMLARPVIKELDQQGFEVRLFSRNVNSDMFHKDFDIVNGDVFNPPDLEKAMDGCQAVHISLSNVDEAAATKLIVTTAQKAGIQLITTISGCTVSEENRWFPMIERKFQAEQAIIKSGIPYMIFRASWFFESLELMVRNGKATIIGKQAQPYHWIAAQDYAKMVGEAYRNEQARNKKFFMLGTEPYFMKELLEGYCEIYHPEIKKVSNLPTGMLKLIALLSRNKKLKEVAEMFRYFEKTKEMGDTTETYALLGKPETNFQKWLETKD